MNKQFSPRRGAPPTLLGWFAGAWLGTAHLAWPAPVLMISVDGLKPEYVLQADARGLKVPFLRLLVAEGAYAQGVTGVWPTNTYPSHTTLITGTWPAEHGILNNPEFDPARKFGDSWYWYAAQIRVPTLWDAAHGAGLTTASVGWPVSVGATDVDALIPEYWRISGRPEDLNPSDRLLIAALSRPVDLLAEMQRRLGPYLMGNDISRGGDAIKTRFAVDILQRRKPSFMTIHLSSLDYNEHEYGPFSTQADDDLEAIDGMLSELAGAARANDPSAVVLVVSDHGFVPVSHRVNLFIPFIQAGLIDLAADPQTGSARVASWQAMPWMASGMAAVMLHDGDSATRLKLAGLLAQLAANPANGIDAVLDRGEIRERGAFPDADFLIVLRPGWYTGAALSGELVTPFGGSHGGHGFSPADPSMRAAFFIAGTGISRHRDLGLIDMRRIAPTVAAILRVPLAVAAAPLKVGPAAQAQPPGASAPLKQATP